MNTKSNRYIIRYLTKAQEIFEHCYGPVDTRKCLCALLNPCYSVIRGRIESHRFTRSVSDVLGPVELLFYWHCPVKYLCSGEKKSYLLCKILNFLEMGSVFGNN